jgi:flagellar capping protein FliD
VSTSSTSPTTNTQTTSATPLFDVGGIATGFDTNSIINELLSIDRQPETLIQQSTVEQARETALQQIQTQMQALRTAAQAMRDPAVWSNSQTVTSSNTAAVTAVLTGGAAHDQQFVGVHASVINNQLVLSGQVTGAANKISVHRLRRDGRPPWRHPPNPWACSKRGQTPFGAVTGC